MMYIRVYIVVFYLPLFLNPPPLLLLLLHPPLGLLLSAGCCCLHLNVCGCFVYFFTQSAL